MNAPRRAASREEPVTLPSRKHSAEGTPATNDEFDSSLVRAILEASPDGILVVDEKAVIAAHNQRFVEIWKIPRDHLGRFHSDTAIGEKDAPILAAVLEYVKDRDTFLARVHELYDNPQMNDHCEIELRDGRTLERHSTVLRSHTGDYLGRVWFFRDITVQKRTEAALKELARHDPLTGAINRRYFFERANQEFARAKRHAAPLCIAEIDIDHFKLINDQYGHAAGDEVLKTLCDDSRRTIRENELFARIGGEEFAILMPDTGIDGAAHLTERLRTAIAGRKLPYKGEYISCTVSIGIAALRASDTAIEDCLQRADHAMYGAKQKGRNRIEVEV
jgi:diguanylate cyclase (GGDEF)-like protein